jgi:hypothetical protein
MPRLVSRHRHSVNRMPKVDIKRMNVTFACDPKDRGCRKLVRIKVRFLTPLTSNSPDQMSKDSRSRSLVRARRVRRIVFEHRWRRSDVGRTGDTKDEDTWSVLAGHPGRGMGVPRVGRRTQSERCCSRVRGGIGTIRVDRKGLRLLKPCMRLTACKGLDR